MCDFVESNTNGASLFVDSELRREYYDKYFMICPPLNCILSAAAVFFLFN